MEIEDEFKWLDDFWPDVTESKEPECLIIASNIRSVTFVDDKWVFENKTWKTKNHNKLETLVVENKNIGSISTEYLTSNVTKEERLQKLFDLITEHKIKRLIFNNCSFFAYLRIEPLSSITELIFNNCLNPKVLLSCFLSFSKGKLYSLRTLIFRKINNFEDNLGLLTYYLSLPFHFIKDLKSIDYLGYRKINEPIDKILKTNQRGYKKCEMICLSILFMKKTKRSSLLNIIDLHVVKNIVGMIWNSRYALDWYV
jgi:hypothetical protein